MKTPHTPRTPPLRRFLPALAALAVLSLGLMVPLLAPPAGAAEMMPELPKVPADRWVNTAPLTKADFLGHVVLIEVYTST